MDTTPVVAEWAGRIRPHLMAAAESIIAAGKELLAAKEALPHGEFGPLLDELGLTPRTAQRFMAIARHPVLSDPTRVSHLPGAWGTLYELSRLDDEVIAAAITSGKVSPSMRRDDVQSLAPGDDAWWLAPEQKASLAASLAGPMYWRNLTTFEAFRRAVGISDEEWHQLVEETRGAPVDWDACRVLASIGGDEFDAVIKRCIAKGDLSLEAAVAEVHELS